MAVCDPFGRIGILHCPSFNNSACISIPGVAEGCQAPQGMYGGYNSHCMKLNASYMTGRTWDAVVYGVGSSTYSVLQFNHCGGSDFCGTMVNSFGHQAMCMCQERSMFCSGVGTIYDVAYRSSGVCQWVKGSSLQCSMFGGYCSKGYTNGFPYYQCL
jgi:hypothetical protein